MSTITAFPSLYRREDSRAIVANIRAHPDDDTARLAYADWLEEMASEDAAHESHYLSRCEFIRAGCCNPGKSLTRLNRAESRWLDGNWRRLFPTLMQVHGYYNTEPVLGPVLWRKGRVLRFSVRYNIRPGHAHYHDGHFHPRDYAGYFTAHLRRGFIDAIDWHSNLPYWTRLMPAIAKDDPFVCCRFLEYAPVVQHEDGTWSRRIRLRDVGYGVFKLLKPTVFGKVFVDSDANYASYMDRDQLKTLGMAARDLNRASREWAEAAPIAVSMTDAEFYGDIHRLAVSMPV